MNFQTHMVMVIVCSAILQLAMSKVSIISYHLGRNPTTSDTAIVPGIATALEESSRLYPHIFTNYTWIQKIDLNTYCASKFWDYIKSCPYFSKVKGQFKLRLNL